MINRMKEVASILGVEFEKSFKIEGYEWYYRINQKGLYNQTKHKYSDEMLGCLLRGSERIRMDDFLEKLHNKFEENAKLIALESQLKGKQFIVMRPRGCSVSKLVQKFKESKMESLAPLMIMDGINTNDSNKNAPEVESESTDGIFKSCSTCRYEDDWDSSNKCVDCIDGSKWRVKKSCDNCQNGDNGSKEEEWDDWEECVDCNHQNRWRKRNDR